MRHIAIAAALVAASATAQADTYSFVGTVGGVCPTFPPGCASGATISVMSDGDGTFGSGSVTSAIFGAEVNGSQLIPAGAGEFLAGSTFTGSPLSFTANYIAPRGEGASAFLNWDSHSWNIFIARFSSFSGQLTGVTFNGVFYPVPEPSSLALLVAGIATFTLALVRKRLTAQNNGWSPEGSDRHK